MNLREFEKQYRDLLTGNDENKLEKLIQLVSDNIDNEEISVDYIRKVSDELVRLRNQEITPDDIIKEHQDNPIVELENVFEEIDDETELNSDTLKGQRFAKLFNKKNLKRLAIGGLALAATYGVIQQVQQPQYDQTTDVQNDVTTEYEKLAVKEGTNFNPNDLNQLTQAAADFGIELSNAGFSSYYNIETGEYKPVTAEDALMTVEALNLGSNEYDEWRKAQIKHDASSATRYDEVMNELYTFVVADSMSLTNNTNSKIDYAKFVSNQELAEMLNGLQDDIIEYNDAKPENKKNLAKSLLDKWVTAMENRSDLPTNDAIMSIMQAQMYGFVNRMQFDGYSFSEVGFDESRFANVFYDLPSCKEIDKDAYNAYWHGNTRTEDSDVTVNRMDRKVDFEGFFAEVKTDKELINSGVEEKKYNDDAEWDDLVDLVQKKMGSLEVTPNPDFTQAKVDAMLAESGSINLKPGETIQYDGKGNAYILKGGTTKDESANLPSVDEVTEQVEEEKKEMQQDASAYYDIGMADAMANGDRTGSLINVPGGISEAQRNGYRNGYNRGVEYNKLAYQLGLEGQSLTSDLANCKNAYNAGYQQYQANKQQEDDQQQQEQEDYQKLAEEAYNAGFAAFESGASRDSIPDKYKEFAIEWQNGWDNAKDIKDHNVGEIIDSIGDGSQVSDGNSNQIEQKPSTPDNSLPEEQPSTPDDSQKEDETPVSNYTWNDVYNAGIQAAYAAGANTNGAPCPACPTEYAGLEDAWAAGWGTALLEYEMNQEYYASQAAQQAQLADDTTQKTR